MMVRGAQVLLTAPAQRTCSAADPRIHRDAPADLCVGRIFARSLDNARDLMAERERQRTVLGDIEPLVATQRKITVLQMQVGMADAAALDPHQHFGAARFWRIDHRLAERLAVRDQRLAMHRTHGGYIPTFGMPRGIMP